MPGLARTASSPSVSTDRWCWICCVVNPRKAGPIWRDDAAQPAIAFQHDRRSATGWPDRSIGKIYGGKGQPPTNYRIAADRGYGIGLHVDRDFIRAALVDFDFVQRFGMRRPLTARSVDGVKDILTDMINELIAAAAVPVDRIWGSASPPRDFAMPMYWTLQASKGRSGANCTAMRSIGALPKRGTWPSSSRTTPTPAPWLN